MGKCGVNWCIYSFERPTTKGQPFNRLNGWTIRVCVCTIGWLTFTHPYLRNTDTERKAKVADKDTYCGREHLRCASFWWIIMSRSSSMVGVVVVTLLEQG